MSAIEARTDAEAGAAHVGGKRKAGGKGAGGARKKGPGAAALSTQVRLTPPPPTVGLALYMLQA